MSKTMTKTLKRLYEMEVQLTNEENRKAFRNFMAKVTVLA